MSIDLDGAFENRAPFKPEAPLANHNEVKGLAIEATHPFDKGSTGPNLAPLLFGGSTSCIQGLRNLHPQGELSLWQQIEIGPMFCDSPCLRPWFTSRSPTPQASPAPYAAWFFFLLVACVIWPSRAAIFLCPPEQPDTLLASNSLVSSVRLTRLLNIAHAK